MHCRVASLDGGAPRPPAVGDFARKRRAFQQHGKRPFKRVVASQPLDLPTGVRTLGEHRSKQLLKRYGVPVVDEVLLTPSDIEQLTSTPLAFPVAVKIESPDLPHKTEAGAVRLGVQNLAGIKAKGVSGVFSVTNNLRSEKG
jgi:acyl-CoA synthetase (NDP forming)